MGKYFDFQYMIESFPVFLSYLDVTAVVTIVSEALALALGGLVAIALIHRLPFLALPSRVYVSFVRGTPFLVQLYLVCFGLPQFLRAFQISDVRSLPVILLVLLAMVLHSGAYMAEILRGSILALDKGQMEAAYSVGMTTAQAYRRVLLPQALRMAMPALSNEVVSALKNTSLMFNVGIVDMMSKADLMGAYSYRNLELYLDVGLIYILLTFLVHGSVRLLEIRMSHGRALAGQAG